VRCDVIAERIALRATGRSTPWPCKGAPRGAIFDVNETLSDLSGLVPRLTEVGAPPAVLPAWFVATLRDGLALTTAGCLADLAALGSFTLASILRGRRRSPRDA